MPLVRGRVRGGGADDGMRRREQQQWAQQLHQALVTAGNSPWAARSMGPSWVAGPPLRSDPFHWPVEGTCEGNVDLLTCVYRATAGAVVGAEGQFTIRCCCTSPGNAACVLWAAASTVASFAPTLKDAGSCAKTSPMQKKRLRGVTNFALIEAVTRLWKLVSTADAATGPAAPACSI